MIYKVINPEDLTVCVTHRVTAICTKESQERVWMSKKDLQLSERFWRITKKGASHANRVRPLFRVLDR